MRRPRVLQKGNPNSPARPRSAPRNLDRGRERAASPSVLGDVTAAEIDTQDHVEAVKWYRRPPKIKPHLFRIAAINRHRLFLLPIYFFCRTLVTIPPALGKSFLLFRVDRRRKFSCSNHRTCRSGFWHDTAQGWLCAQLPRFAESASQACCCRSED